MKLSDLDHRPKRLEVFAACDARVFCLAFTVNTNFDDLSNAVGRWVSA
jgi:hypothetical protein